jgi:hypothetical protein
MTARLSGYTEIQIVVTLQERAVIDRPYRFCNSDLVQVYDPRNHL